jgi:hypothetical protein
VVAVRLQEQERVRVAQRADAGEVS